VFREIIRDLTQLLLTSGLIIRETHNLFMLPNLGN